MKMLKELKKKLSPKKSTKEKKKKDSKSKPKKNIILIALMFLGIGAVSLGIIFLIFVIITAPEFDPDRLYSQESTVLLDKDGNEIGVIGAENRELVFFEDLPQVLIDAIVSTEDARFFQHGGFDLPRFIRASFGQIAGDSGAGGASTLTMQISKNAFTDARLTTGFEGMTRKFTDIYMAVFQIERTYTKEEIMEFYVNSPWLGSNSWGVEQASQTFFGKSVRDLNLAEASLMAGLFQLPHSFNPFTNPERAEARRRTVLDLMVKHGYITTQERDIANSISVESMLVDRSTHGFNPNQGFIDTVVEDVISKTGLNPYEVPMIIHTTMDANIQNVLNDLMAGKLHTYPNDEIQNALAVTSIHDGSIVGIANGRNKFGEREFNLAADSKMRRHPGSTAKPIFAFGPNVEFNNGSSYSMFLDEPHAYSTGQPINNADLTYMGLITSRQVLTHSRNIPSLRAFQENDPKNISAFVRAMGIDHGPHLYESMALGAFEMMNPLILSAAYATFGRGGYYIEPYAFTKIIFRQNGEVKEYKPQKVRAMSEETAYIMNFMLMSGSFVRVNGTDIATKTGTSSYSAEARRQFNVPGSAIADSWVGVYSPDYSIGLWYGYEELRTGRFVTMGAAGTARRAIATAVGTRIFPQNSRFNVPSGVVQMEVELETFPPMMPSPFTPNELRSTEVFRIGTEPSEISPRFSVLPNPTRGTSNVNNSTITLSWEKIETPWAINRQSLESHFRTYYSNHADKYLERRLNFNNANIGTIGYQVFLRNGDNLTSLGFTPDNTFTYNATSNGQHTFVVKSVYSIFKANISSGLEIVVNMSGSNNNNPGSGGTGNTNNNNDDGSNNSGDGLSIIPNGPNNISVCRGGAVDPPNPLTAYFGGIDVTSMVTIDREFFRMTGVNRTPITIIDTQAVGNYRIVYRVTYQGQTRTWERSVEIRNC